MEERIEALGKMDILRCKTLKRELVPIPEWGGSIWIQEMTGKEKDKFDTWVTHKEDNEGGFRVRLVIATAVDKNGKPLFTDLDIPDLYKKSGKAIGTISEKAMELSGMNEASQEKLVKNSETDPSEDSSSDSAKS